MPEEKKIIEHKEIKLCKQCGDTPAEEGKNYCMVCKFRVKNLGSLDGKGGVIKPSMITG